MTLQQGLGEWDGTYEIVLFKAKGTWCVKVGVGDEVDQVVAGGRKGDRRKMAMTSF